MHGSAPLPLALGHIGLLEPVCRNVQGPGIIRGVVWPPPIRVPDLLGRKEGEPVRAAGKARGIRAQLHGTCTETICVHDRNASLRGASGNSMAPEMVSIF